MFALRKMVLVSAVLLGMAGVTQPAVAAETSSGYDVKVPITVTFNGVRAGDVPFYVSIQTADDYRSMKGHGGILLKTDGGSITQTYSVPSSGDYAITVWHDLDNDGRFSMTEDYRIEDGWASSGTIPMGTAPSFGDAKINIPTYGTSVAIDMIYPDN